jgi:hypothetical protein
VTVFDLQGRVVRRLLDGSLPAGARLVDWDGFDGRGWPLAAGVYFVRVEVGGRSAAGKVLLMR